MLHRPRKRLVQIQNGRLHNEMYQIALRAFLTARISTGLDYTPHGANTAFDTPNRLQSPALRGGKGQKELRISPPRHLEDAFTLAGR